MLYEPNLQVWNLEVIPAGGSPALLRTIKVLPAAGKAPEVEVTGLQVHEALWPRFSIAIGTSASHIHLLRGELGAFSAHATKALSQGPAGVFEITTRRHSDKRCGRLCYVGSKSPAC